MRHRHDSFTKKFLRRVLDSEGTFTAEMEVSPDAQRFDGYFVPHRAHAARRRDLLDRLTTRACAFEAFRAAPSPAEIESCVRKILNARHVLTLARPPKPLPSLWILCAGDPREGLDHAGARAKRGFPRGVYQTPAVLHTGLVVLSQLPETPNTLILRVMGAGRTLKRALAELERLPEDARERHVALPALLEYRVTLLEQPTRTPEDEEFRHSARFSGWILADGNIALNSPTKSAIDLWVSGMGCGLVEPRPRAYGQPDGRQTAAVHEVAHRLAGRARPHRVHSPDGCSRISFSEWSRANERSG